MFILNSEFLSTYENKIPCAPPQKKKPPFLNGLYIFLFYPCGYFYSDGPWLKQECRNSETF